MPTATRNSGLIERCSLRAYSRRQLVGIALGLRVGELRVELRQRGQLLGRAAHDPDRLAAPFDGELLARLDAADVDLDRRAGGAGALGRLEAADEGHGGEPRADGTGAARCDDPGALAAVDLAASLMLIRSSMTPVRGSRSQPDILAELSRRPTRRGDASCTA